MKVQTASAPPRAVTTRRSEPGWRIVAEQETRDLWVGGRGPLLVFVYSILLSVITYLTATNQLLNFLEQREAVNLTLQTAVATGVLVTLLVSADGLSGERERGTLESLLLTPVTRRGIVAGKLAAALTLWFATWLVSIPYLWVLGRGVKLMTEAVSLGLLAGTLLAVALAAFGLLISSASNSNKVSLAASLFLLIALFAPTQTPLSSSQSWLSDVLIRVNPVGSTLHYLTAVLVKGHSWTQDLSYLISPFATATIAGAVLFIAGPRIVRLTGGVSAG